MTGRFISLEGGEGVGKTTQLSALKDWLETQGLTVLTTREPGGTDSAEAVRRLLLEGGADRWTAQAEALLFAAARSDHVARRIRPALTRGEWVLCDRFVDSSRAYQGHAMGLEDAEICALHRFASGDLLPDRTFILEVSPAAAATRIARRNAGSADDRIGTRDAGFHAAVRDGFRAIAAAEPERCRLIDADAPADEVTARLVAALVDLLP